MIYQKNEKKTTEHETFFVPRELVGRKIFIDCSEFGGATTLGGEGTVVCGLSGKPLSPYYRFKIKVGEEALGRITQAKFSVPGSVISILARSRDERVLVQRNDVLIEDETATLKKTVLWDGSPVIAEAVCPICGKYFFEYPSSHLNNKENCWGRPSLRKILVSSNVSIYHDAIIAAMNKARCVYCRCCHYVDCLD